MFVFAKQKMNFEAIKNSFRKEEKNPFLIYTFFSDKAGVKAVIFYTIDESTAGSSVVSMEVDKKTFMNVIKDSQFKAKPAKPLKFAQDNGFFRLLEGESTSFSFATVTGTAECSCQCEREKGTTPLFTTPPTVRSTTTPSVPKSTITIRTTPKPPVTTIGTTQKPPVTTVETTPKPPVTTAGTTSRPPVTTGGTTPRTSISTTVKQTTPPGSSLRTVTPATSRTSTPGPTYLPSVSLLTDLKASEEV